VIELAEQDGVAVLRLAHGKVNAMRMEFCEALTARFAEISSARAVVMTATGRTFSAGVDLVRLLEGGAPYVRKFLPVLSEMFATVFMTWTASKAVRLWPFTPPPNPARGRR
jgi:enoyl-CoA hydratase